MEPDTWTWPDAYGDYFDERDTVAKRQPNPVFPATVLIDSREQRAFTFRGISADVGQGGGNWSVPTEVVKLDAGDYSLDGYATAIACERKSHSDLLHTIGQERDRFQRELERLNAMQVAYVVVEADWHAVLNDPPPYSSLSAKTVFRSVIAWQQRFTRVHWWFVNNRDWAEVTTLRIFERWLKEQQENSFRKPAKV
jgi:ERCC4-type nuclease